MAIGNIDYVPYPSLKRNKTPDSVDGGTESAQRQEDVHCEQHTYLGGAAEELGVVIRPVPAFPEYVTLRSRIASFVDYPAHCKNDPLQMAKAGLFYNGFGENDRVVCFQCSGALYMWDDEDVPIEEHARWYPGCPFVRLFLGQPGLDLINQAHQEILHKVNQLEGTEDDVETLTAYYQNQEATRFFEAFGITRATFYNAMKGMTQRGEDISKPELVEAALKKLLAFEQHPIQPMEAPPSSDVSPCAACQQEERGIIFFPCGHVAACVNCAAAITTCPICKGKIAGSMRASFRD